MIANPVSRRALVAGGLTATLLTGCSIDVGSPEDRDPEAADRSRIEQARERSQLLLDIVNATLATLPAHKALTSLHALHTQQIAVFVSAAGLTTPTVTPMTAPAPVDIKTLTKQEQSLARDLRSLALSAVRGDVASLLASAATGIEQNLVRMT